MNRVWIYRLEGEMMAQGPFQGAWRGTACADLSPEHKSCTVRFDSAPHPSYHYVFACMSEEDLKAYFGKSLEKLLHNGYKINKYLVTLEDLIIGKGEVAVPRDNLPSGHPLSMDTLPKNVELTFRDYIGKWEINEDALGNVKSIKALTTS